jgi:phosphate-selective porin
MKKLIPFIVVASFLIPFFSVAQGCLGGDSDEGVKVVGYIQPQYEYQFLGEDVDPLHGLKSDNSFYFNRARVGVVGNIPYDFSYYFLLEMSPTIGGPMICDAFITYKRFDPYLNVSMGQFKMPFGLELSTACQSLHTINRSRVVNELASPFRDIGVVFLGSSGELLFGKKDFIQYNFAVTNGTGWNVMDNNTFKDYTFRLVVTPIEGISLGGSYKYGKQKPVSDTMEADIRRRWGADLSFEKYNFLLQAEYIDGYDKGSSLVGGGCGATPSLVLGDFKKNGFMAMLGYKFNFNLQPMVKFESYDPDTDTEFDKQNDWTFGFNYWFNEWTRLQLNYVYRTEETGSITDESGNITQEGIEIDNDFIVMQLQVIF